MLSDPGSTETNTEPTAEATSPSGDPDTIYVAVDGSKGAAGTRDDPRVSIQTAFDVAEPGETVHVLPGEYREYVRAETGGEPGEPITISGPREAVIRPPLEEQEGRPLLQVRANHVHLTGCTFDGLVRPDRPEEVRWYGSGLDVKPRSGDRDYLTDVKLMPAAVGNTRTAMISVRRTKNLEVGEFEVIGPAGAAHLYGDRDGHNGEIVYVGTAIDNTGADFYDWETIDETSDVHIHHIDNSAGYPHAELVDAKPGTRNVRIEYCTDSGGSGAYTLPGHDETDEAAVGLRGRDGTLRYSFIEDGHGQAVQVGSWGLANQERFEELNGMEYPEAATDSGQGNAIYGNRLTGNNGLAIRFPMDADGIAPNYGPDAQQYVCGNTYDGKTHGDPDAPCPDDVPAGDGIGHTSGARKDELPRSRGELTAE